MSKQISLLKISLILQEMKVNLKSHKRLFNRKPFNWEKKSASQVLCLRKLESL